MTRTNTMPMRFIRHMQSVFKLLIVFAIVSLHWPQAAEAQSRRGGLPLIRDAEIEGLLQDYTAPIFRAAGLGHNSVQVFILNRNEFNAFVTGSRMFIHTGAIMQAETPNEIIGVFAHETGHILGGHLVLLRDRLERARVLSVLSLLAGAGAAASGVNNGGSLGAAIATSGTGAIQRGLLSYQREDEIAADRTGVTLLNKTSQSGLGMLNTFKRLGQNPLFRSSNVDPYRLSHPLPRERIALLDNVVRKSPHFDKLDSPQLQLRHDMARAKIAAYTGGAGLVRNIFKKEINGPAGTYGTAISHFLSGVPRKGLPMIDKLIRKQPNNPYLHEMKGEILLRSGQAAKAVGSFERAIKLDKRQNGIMYVQMGHALLETNNKKNIDRAIKTLKAGIGRDRYSSRGHGLLARAYAAKGEQVNAIASTAEARFLQGNFKDAKQFASRALPKLKAGTPQWRRLKDIMAFRK